jgi:NAD(P)-dependent dehydrogenase (short-subunit alcohol dehydrogenase family)
MPLPPPVPEGTSMLPKGSFDGRVVAITGGGTGLGKAFALEFARLGAAIAVLSRNEAHRRRGVEAVVAIGGRAVEVPLDVRDALAVAGAFDEIERSLGPVDVFLNNAAGNFPCPAEDLSPNGFRSVVQIDLEGTFNCSREFARRAIGAGRTGTILNIGAPTYHGGGPGFAHVAAAKAGVHNLTYSLAVEWAPYGIRVNALVPGFFPHDDLPKDVFQANVGTSAGANTPAQRLGQPHELAWAATYLCSPFAAMVTGSVFVMDGAMSLSPGPKPAPFTPVREQLGRPPFHLPPR